MYDFKKLSEEIAKVSLGTARMTDVKAGVYHIDISKDGEKVSLVSEDKKIKVNINTNNFASLAALRIVESQEAAKKAKTTREARSTEGYGNLQDALNNEKIALDSTTKFTVVHQLQIIDLDTDKPTFKNEHYKGYPEYVKTSRKAANMPATTEDERTARAAAFAEASESLRKSGVKSGTTEADENLLLMPVFTVTAK